MFFYSFYQCRISLRNQLTSIKHIHMIYGYSFKYFKVMCNNNQTIVLIIVVTKHLSDRSKCIHIQSAVYFIQKHIPWLQQLELQYLNLSSFSATKAYINISPKEISWYRKLLAKRLYHLLERQKCFI